MKLWLEKKVYESTREKWLDVLTGLIIWNLMAGGIGIATFWLAEILDFDWGPSFFLVIPLISVPVIIRTFRFRLWLARGLVLGYVLGLAFPLYVLGCECPSYTAPLILVGGILGLPGWVFPLLDVVYYLTH